MSETTEKQEQFTPEQEKVIRQAQKLFNIHAAAPDSEEGKSALAKAQELMTRVGVDAATVEQNSGKLDGKRAAEHVAGGTFLFQRKLWEAVAEMNFCFYQTQEYWAKLDKPRWYYSTQSHVTHQKKTRHHLIGRTVNIAMTKMLAGYLEQAIDRELRNKVPEGQQRRGLWATAFRYGMADELLEKITTRFKKNLAEEAKKRKKALGEKPAGGWGTSLTVTETKVVEEAGNYDFVHGEGAYARMKADEAQYAKEQAEREAAYTEWAKQHPEEARQKEEEQRKRYRRYYRGNGGRSYEEKMYDKFDHHAYHAGRDSGKSVPIDPQVDPASRPAGKIGRSK
jgi:hypothetical protein